MGGGVFFYTLAIIVIVLVRSKLSPIFCERL